MSKKELVDQVAQKAGLTKDQANRALDAVLSSITESLAKGEEIRLPKFGTFLVTKRKERQGRNPSTGEAIKIPASNQARFKPSQALKDAANAA